MKTNTENLLKKQKTTGETRKTIEKTEVKT